LFANRTFFIQTVHLTFYLVDLTKKFFQKQFE
jgi:hypothetical protein